MLTKAVAVAVVLSAAAGPSPRAARRDTVGRRAAMNTSLDHLPAESASSWGAVATIRAEVPEAGMIILFGSHARGAFPHNPQTGYRSDFDLLVVVDGEEVACSARVWERVRAAIEQHTTTVDIIAHDFREVNHAACKSASLPTTTVHANAALDEQGQRQRGWH